MLILSVATAHTVMAQDDDSDGMSNTYELLFGLDIANPADALLDYDLDTLNNLAESLLGTDPFESDTDFDGFSDNNDATPLSRLRLCWGSPFFTYGDQLQYTGPAWWKNAFKSDGQWATNPPCWTVSGSNNIGTLVIELDHLLLTNNIVMDISLEDNPDASLYIDLLDTNLLLLATDVAGNIINGAGGAITKTVSIPWASYPDAAFICLRRGTGEVRVYESLLYVDNDGDRLDISQEAQLGTSDFSMDSDSDGVTDYDEVFIHGTDPSVSLGLPLPLSHCDIGAVSAAGSASFNEGTYSVTASGADIWNVHDEFHYVYRQLKGDCEIISRVESIDYINVWSKAGVMMRETLTDNSPFAMLVVSPARGAAFQWRTLKGETCGNKGVSGILAPYWVKMVRTGNTFTGYRSVNGVTWTLVYSRTIEMSQTVYVGLAVTSHADGKLCTAKFTDVAVTGTEPLKYNLTVENGSGDGLYYEQTYVRISADPAPTGKVFKAWSGFTNGIENVLVPNMTLLMPSSGAVTTATYEDDPEGYDLGLIGEYYDFTTAIYALPNFITLTSTLSRIESELFYANTRNLWPGLPSTMKDTFAGWYRGYIKIDIAGEYTFYLQSDDGSKMWLDNNAIIDNNGLHGFVEKTAAVTLEPGMHEICIQYFAYTGTAGLILSYAGPYIDKTVIPAEVLWHGEDTDGDGIPDIWELEHFGSLSRNGDGDFDGDGLIDRHEWRSWADPNNADSDGDGVSDYDEVVLHNSDPNRSDSDGDGMPDEWESVNGTFIAMIDSGGDPDYDNVNNIEEYFNSTDPQNPDTDGDGMNDYLELFLSFSDALVTDFDGTSDIADSVAGAEADSFTGEWEVAGSTLKSIGRRGTVNYTVTVPSDNVYLLEVFGDMINSTAEGMAATIDGHYVGANLLEGDSSVKFFTTWLKAGTHSVALKWNNLLDGPQLIIKEVKLSSLGGPDNNGNGRADWIDNRLKAMVSVDNTDIISKTSPYCLEGNASYIDMIDLSDGSQPKHGAGERWYANVPLSASGTTPLTVSFQDAAVMRSVNISWQTFNILNESDISVRKNDSLLFNACPTGATNGMVEIKIGSLAPYITDVANPIAHQFSQAGTYLITGKYTDNSIVMTNSIKVSVIEAAFPTNELPVMLERQRLVNCPNMPFANNVVIEADSFNEITNVTKYGVNSTRFYITPREVDSQHYMVARLGADGAILDNMQLLGFWGEGSIDKSVYRIDTLPDGSDVSQCRMITDNLPENVHIKLWILKTGVVFDDGTTVRIITAADVSDTGEYIYNMISPDNFGTICHIQDVYDGTTLVGRM